MATYQITSPDGGVFEITAPDDAPESDVLAYAQANFKSAAPASPSLADNAKGIIGSTVDTIRDIVPGMGKSKSVMDQYTPAADDSATAGAIEENAGPLRKDYVDRLKSDLRANPQMADALAKKDTPIGLVARGVKEQSERRSSGDTLPRGRDDVLADVEQGTLPPAAPSNFDELISSVFPSGELPEDARSFREQVRDKRVAKEGRDKRDQFVGDLRRSDEIDDAGTLARYGYSAVAGAGNALGSGISYLGMKSGADKVTEIGDRIQDVARARTPANQSLSEEVAGGLGSVFASILSAAPAMLLAESAPVAAGIAAVAGWAPRLAKGLQVIKGTAPAVFAGAFEAAGNSTETYDRVLQKTGDKSLAQTQADKTFLSNLPLNAALDKFGLFGDSGTVAKKIIMSGGMEGLQEGSQRAISNYFSADPTGQGITHDALIGALTGAGAKAVMAPFEKGSGPSLDQGDQSSSAPSGSFSAMNEFADLVGQERADIQQRRRGLIYTDPADAVAPIMATPDTDSAIQASQSLLDEVFDTLSKQEQSSSIPALKTEITPAQADALTRAQGFDEQSPTAMQLALQRAIKRQPTPIQETESRGDQSERQDAVVAQEGVAEGRNVLPGGGPVEQGAMPSGTGGGIDIAPVSELSSGAPEPVRAAVPGAAVTPADQSTSTSQDRTYGTQAAQAVPQQTKQQEEPGAERQVTYPAYTKTQATLYAKRMTGQGLLSVVIPHPSEAGKFAIVPEDDPLVMAQKQRTDVPDASASDIVTVKDKFGRTMRVRQDDLDSGIDRIPTVRANGDIVTGEEIPRSILAKQAQQPAAPPKGMQDRAGRAEESASYGKQSIEEFAATVKNESVAAAQARLIDLRRLQSGNLTKAEKLTPIRQRLNGEEIKEEIARQEQVIAEADARFSPGAVRPQYEALAAVGRVEKPELDGKVSQQAKEPWQMTRDEWERARNAVRPEVAQSNFTRASGSQASADASRLSQLLYGVTDDASARMAAAQRGEIELSPDELEQITERLEARVSHQDVIEKAIAEGKPVPQEAVADYPELATQVKETPATLTMRPTKAGRRPPIERRNDIIGAIMRVTDGKGIAAHMALTIVGDTANNATKLRGLFINKGWMDLSEIATQLKNEGFYVRDEAHLVELIQDQARGVRVQPMDDQVAELDAGEERKYRDEIRRMARKFGVRTVGVKFDAMQSEVLRLMEQRHNSAVARLEARDKARFEAAIESINGAVSDHEIDALLNRAFEQHPTDARAFWRAATQDMRGLIADIAQEEIANEQRSGTPEGFAGQPEGFNGGEAGLGSLEEEGGFALQGQTTAEARAEAERIDAAIDAEDAEAQRAADSRRQSGIDAEIAGRQDIAADNFTLDGQVNDAAKQRAIDKKRIDDQLAGQGDIFSTTEQSSAVDEVTRAKEILDAANVTGRERTATIAEVRRGDLTSDDVAEAHPGDAASEGKPGAVEEESAVYTVNEADDISGDLFPEEIQNEVPNTGIGTVQRGQSAAVGAGTGVARKTLSVRPSEDTPGLYHVNTQIITVGKRKLPVNRIRSWDDAAKAFANLSRYAVEHFDAIVTDRNGKILAIIGSFKGTASQAAVYPSTLMMELSRIGGAANVWASHNHPSSVTELSGADINLSTNIAEILRGSSINYRGLSAMARKGDSVSWASTDGGFGRVDYNQPDRYPVPIVEREIIEANPRDAVSSPAIARSLVVGVSNGVPGVVFLNYQNQLTAFVPFDPDAMGELRSGDRLMRLFSAASKSGASAAIVAMPDNKISNRQFGNLKNALAAIDVRVIDGLKYSSTEDAPIVSMAETGAIDDMDGTGFMSIEEDLQAAQSAAIDRAIAQEKQDAEPETTRGADRLRLKLRQAQRKGDLSAKAVELVEWLVKQNPALVKYLAVAVENPKEFMEGFNQPAYHGSPYKFDRFTLDHIGKGEGAQAYGFGLYFASRRGVAEYYREALSKTTPSHNTLDGKRITKKLLGELQKSEDSAVRNFFNSKTGMRAAGITGIAKGIDDAIETAQENRDDYQQRLDRYNANPPIASTYGPADYSRFIASYDNQIEGLQKLKSRIGFNKESKSGQLYEVEIPEDGSYLLWDKPLSEQSEKVLAAMNYIGKPGTFSVRLPADKGGWVVDFDAEQEGKRAYASLSKELGGDEAASKYLNSLGITGIKYLDGVSRNRPLREVKREFLAELPEDADFAEVSDLLGTGTFSPANESIIKALQADDWLGFDYPAQALSAALGGELANFDASQALKDAVSAAQDGSTYNYVIFNENAIKVLQTFYDRPTGAAGNYNPFTQVMTLFRGSASDTTAIHEILHHLERMMPAEMQAEIRKEWRKAATKEMLAAMKAKDQPRIAYFKAVLAGDQKRATELLTGKGMDGFNAVEPAPTFKPVDTESPYDPVTDLVSGVGDEVATLYHGTSDDGYAGIQEAGYIRGSIQYDLPGDGRGISLSPDREVAEEYANGGPVIEVQVPVSALSVDRETRDDDDVESALDDGASVYAKARRLYIRQPTISNTGELSATNPDIRQDLAIGQDYQYLNPSEYWAVRMTSTAQARFEAKSIWARSLQWLKEAMEHIKGALGLKSDHPLLKAFDDLIKNGAGEFQSKEMLGSSEVYAAQDNQSDDSRGIDSAMAAKKGDGYVGSRDTSYSVEASTKGQTADVQALNEQLANEQGDKWRNAYVLGNSGKPDPILQALKEVFESTFGTEIVVIRPTSAEFDVIGGMRFNGKIYINAKDRQYGFVQLAGHELMHEIRRSSPKLYAYFADKVRDVRTPGSLRAYQEYLSRGTINNQALESSDTIEEELLADAVGDALVNPAFLKKLAEDGGKFKLLMQKIKNWLRDVSRKMTKEGFESEKYFTDINALHDYIAAVLSAYSEIRTPAAIDSVPVIKYSSGGKSRQTNQQAVQRPEIPGETSFRKEMLGSSEVYASIEKIIDDNQRKRTPEQLAMFKRVGRTVEIPTLAEKVKGFRQDMWKKATQGLVDQFAPIKELSKEAYGLMRLSKGATGAFEVFMHGGRLKLTDNAYDFDDTKKGGVIDRLLTPLQNESGDFMWWVAANRAETLTAESRERLFSPADIAAGKSLADGKTDFDYTLAHGPQAGTVTRDRTLIYRDSLKTFNEFHKNALDMAEQSGMIDPASRAIWEKDFYIPFYRVNDEEGFRGMNIKSGVVRQEAFKQLKGGTDKLNSDLLENTLMNWAHLIDAAAKNRAAVATTTAAVKLGIAQDVPAGTKGAVWVQEGGKKKYYTISDPYVLTALTSLEYAGLRGPVMDALSATKHWLTIGVTASPFFKVRNLIRDSIQVIGTSDISYNPAKNLAEGFKATKRGTDEYFHMLAGGGLIRFGTMLEGNEANRTRALVEKGVDPSTILDNESKVKAFYKRTLEPLIEAYNELGNRGEEINRAALYKQLRSQGVNHADASLEARDLMDFSMQGSWASVRFLTQIVPFMNARLQGMYKLGRAGKQDPARMAAVIGAATMVSLSLLAAYGDDDDWKDREDWDRNNYWWFRAGGIAYRIPKPFEVGAVATLAERTAELMFDKEMTGKRFAQQFRHIMSDQLAMNPTPQAFKPLIDLYANKDSFSGRPIETMSMEKLAPEYRFRQGTSMVARGVSTAGNAVARVAGMDFLSPVQVDHLVRGYFSWLGTFIVGGADLAVRSMSNEPTRPALDYWKTATGGMVAETSGASSRYVSQLYEQAKELEEAHGTYRNLLKEGKTAEAKEYQAENRDKLSRYRSVEAVKRKEAQINNQIRLIERSSADPDTKKARINALRSRQSDIAKALSMRTAR